MEGKVSHSAKKKMKEKLSKTVESKAVTRKSILNRMSSGKKRPKSEPRIKKSLVSPLKDDLLAKRLFDDDVGEGFDSAEPKPSSVKPKKGKSKVVKPGTPAAQSAKKLVGSTSKWQVTKTVSNEKEEGKAALKKNSTKVVKPEQVSKQQEEEEDYDDDDDNYATADGDVQLGNDDDLQDINQWDDAANDDDEVDFPVLKRKSLGLSEKKTSKATSKVKGGTKKVLREPPQNGQTDRTTPEKGKRGNVKGKKMEDENEAGAGTEEKMNEGKKKRRNRRRGKKRKRSNSESEEPQAKKDKPGVFMD